MDAIGASLNIFERAKKLMPTKSAGTIVGFILIGTGAGVMITGVGFVYVFNR